MMKYFLRIILLFVFSVLFNSCQRYLEFDPNASIVGTWQPIKATAKKYVNGIEISKTEDLNVCQQKSRMIYNQDLSAKEIRYDDTSGTCTKTLERDFIYTYDSDSQNLIHTFSDGSVKDAIVISINEKTLIVKGKKEINGEIYDVEVTNIKLNQ